MYPFDSCIFPQNSSVLCLSQTLNLLDSVHLRYLWMELSCPAAPVGCGGLWFGHLLRLVPEEPCLLVPLWGPVCEELGQSCLVAAS